jgi:hypothetical protein
MGILDEEFQRVLFNAVDANRDGKVDFKGIFHIKICLFTE